MITPEEKDALLQQLTQVEDRIHSTSLLPEQFGVEPTKFALMMNQFAERGLLNIKNKQGAMYFGDVKLNVEDFLRRGGFKFEQEIFELNFNKLILEIERLEKENPNLNFEIIAKAISALSAGVSIYKNLNI